MKIMMMTIVVPEIGQVGKEEIRAGDTVMMTKMITDHQVVLTQEEVLAA